MAEITTDANEHKEIAIYLLGNVDACISILGLHNRHRKEVPDTNRINQIAIELENEEFLLKLEEIHKNLVSQKLKGQTR